MFRERDAILGFSQLIYGNMYCTLSSEDVEANNMEALDMTYKHLA